MVLPAPSTSLRRVPANKIPAGNVIAVASIDMHVACCIASINIWEDGRSRTHFAEGHALAADQDSRYENWSLTLSDGPGLYF